MAFCQSFMTELYRHIGPDTDVPAGDIGTGAREIGYMYGQYKRIRNAFEGVLTGKGLTYGGSLARTEATGYGLLYFTAAMLKKNGYDMAGKTVVISGAGNVAIYACQKAQEMGAKVVTMSDSNGWVYDPEGIDLAAIKEIKEVKRARLTEYKNYRPNSEYHEGRGVWSVKCDNRSALRHSERAAGGRRPPAGGKRLHRRGRGRQHAHYHRGHQDSPGGRRAVCPRQGCQRRRRGHLRSGDDPEQRAPLLDLRGG